MARRRTIQTSGDWARRNARAAQLGYRNFYDYRIHDYGRIPPGEPGATGETKQRLRGHRSRADLLRSLGPGDLISVFSSERDTKTGRYKRVDLLVIDENGRQRSYRLGPRQLRQVDLDSLITQVEGAGAVFSPSPSLDIRRLRPDLDVQEEEDGAPDDEEEAA